MIKFLRRKVSHYLFFKKFRSLNKHNLIMPVGKFPLDNIKIGKMSYGPLKVEYWGADGEGIEIGNYVSIARNVTFILGGNHFFNRFSTYPFKVKILGRGYQENYSKGKIIVKDDVWIGLNATILSGITLGQGSVIGAHAVVAKDLPPYAIAVGNPAKVVGYRFDEETRNKLLKFDFSKVDKKFVEENLSILYQKADSHIIDKLIKTQQ